MKNYEKPVVLVNEELAEGVYAASGCYTTTNSKHQVIENGRINYIFQIDAVHDAEHMRYKQRWTVTFSQIVESVPQCFGDNITGIGTNVIQFYTYYTQNPTDNIGAGQMTVTTPGDIDVDIVNIVVEDDL